MPAFDREQPSYRWVVLSNTTLGVTMATLTSLMRGTRFVHDPARVNDPATPVTNVAQGLLRGRERCLNSQVGPPAAPPRGLAWRAAGWYCFSSGTRKSAVACDWGVL